MASNADLVFGAFIPIGERPEEMAEEDLYVIDELTGIPTFLSEDEIIDAFEPNSEFGLMPYQAYVQMKLYF